MGCGYGGGKKGGLATRKFGTGGPAQPVRSQQPQIAEKARPRYNRCVPYEPGTSVDPLLDPEHSSAPSRELGPGGQSQSTSGISRRCKGRRTIVSLCG
jgi:hypothetical protein